MMKFIAIAPLVERIEDVKYYNLCMHSEDASDRFQVKNQGEYIVDDLQQKVYRLKPIDELSSSVETSYLIQISGMSYIASIFEADKNISEYEGSLVRSIEDFCSDFINKVIEKNFPEAGYKFLWVNRTLVEAVDSQNLISNGWLGRGVQNYHHVDYDENGKKISVECKISWGNNIVSINSGSLGRKFILEFCKGMIDAQLIWVNYTELTGKSREITKGMNHGDFDEKKYTYLRDQLLAIYKKRALMNIILDEVETQLQGIRYHVATMSLKAWGLDSVRERLAVNLEILESINNQNHNIVRSKGQSKVDKLLLVLSILTLTQFILMFVDLSYNGGTEIVPGEGFLSLGFLDFIRGVSADVWIVISILFTAIITYSMMRGRK